MQTSPELSATAELLVYIKQRSLLNCHHVYNRSRRLVRLRHAYMNRVYFRRVTSIFTASSDTRRSVSTANVIDPHRRGKGRGNGGFATTQNICTHRSSGCRRPRTNESHASLICNAMKSNISEGPLPVLGGTGPLPAPSLRRHVTGRCMSGNGRLEIATQELEK